MFSLLLKDLISDFIFKPVHQYITISEIFSDKNCKVTFGFKYSNQINKNNIFIEAYIMNKYSNVLRENKCPPPPKPVYGGNFSH